VWCISVVQRHVKRRRTGGAQRHRRAVWQGQQLARQPASQSASQSGSQSVRQPVSHACVLDNRRAPVGGNGWGRWRRAVGQAVCGGACRGIVPNAPTRLHAFVQHAGYSATKMKRCPPNSSTVHFKGVTLSGDSANRTGCGAVWTCECDWEYAYKYMIPTRAQIEY
jgi:hypothetical protein